MSRSEKLLAAYAGLLTAAVVAVMLTGAASSRSAKFDEIDVQRINVREADGTLRLVIASNGRMAQAIYRGKEYPHPNHGKRGGGMLFFNDEGSEMGGLIFSGRIGPDGKPQSGVHLSFDQYEQDQVLVLSNQDHGDRHGAGLSFTDRPEDSLIGLLQAYEKFSSLPEAERDLRFKEWLAQREVSGQVATRLFIGKDPDRNAVLDMKDGEGRSRLRVRVEADGEARIEFLDAEGKVVRSLAPDPG